MSDRARAKTTKRLSKFLLARTSGIDTSNLFHSLTQCRKWPYLPSFLIDLETIDGRIKNVIDMVFLSDYYEPTLAILFQSEQTWTG